MSESSAQSPRPPASSTSARTFAQAICWGALLASILAGTVLGPANFSWAELKAFLLGSAPASSDLTIIADIRLPRLAVAACCGALAAMAGALTQGFFRNPLAAPSVLGLEAGASLGAAAAFWILGSSLSLWSVPLAALVGTAGATLLIMSMAARTESVSVESLLLTGFGLMTITSGLTSLLVTLAIEDHARGTAVMQWMMGSFSGKTWTHLLPVAFFGLPALVLCARNASRLDLLAMGEDIAATSGISMRRLRLEVIAAVSLLVAAVAAMAGALPFVSLVAPHMTRLLLGPAHKRLLVYAALNGAALTIIADTVARTVRAPAELEVGLVTAVIGAPIFLWLLLTNRGNA